jgi:DNA polymerase-3 subunit delta'
MNEVLGQAAAVELLTAAWRSGRVHHAWIFSGPRGVGKYTTARAFAAALLDPGARVDERGVLVAEPDGDVARRVAADTHPDLHVIRKELALYASNPDLRQRKLLNIPLDVLREFMIGGRTGDGRTHDAPAYRKASLGHGKVFVIDEAEIIDANGQNALLKTLEEPPPATYIVLVTSRPERLLPTIHSRCQQVRFGPLDHEAMQAWFDRAALGLDAPARAWVESFAEGAPGVAQLAAEHDLPGWHARLAPALETLARGGFPVGLGEVMNELVDTYATAWVKTHKNASKDAANKDGARWVLLLLAAHARERLRAACADDGEAEAWAQAIRLLADAEEQLRRNVNQRHVLENLVAQWAGALGAQAVSR